MKFLPFDLPGGLDGSPGASVCHPHAADFPVDHRLKQDLLPPTDKGVSALLDDLDARGLLDETLVVVAGEFGRTPKLSRQTPGAIPGRDHWPAVFSAVFGGTEESVAVTFAEYGPAGAVARIVKVLPTAVNPSVIVVSHA